MKGKFIVVEGLDGSGKDVQAVKIVEYLEEKGFTAIRTKEHRKHSTPGMSRLETIEGTSMLPGAPIAEARIGNRQSPYRLNAGGEAATGGL